jgi:hypothetical protein
MPARHHSPSFLLGALKHALEDGGVSPPGAHLSENLGRDGSLFGRVMPLSWVVAACRRWRLLATTVATSRHLQEERASDAPARQKTMSVWITVFESSTPRIVNPKLTSHRPPTLFLPYGASILVHSAGIDLSCDHTRFWHIRSQISD